MAGNLKQRLSLLRGSLPQNPVSPVSGGAVKGLAPEWQAFAENCYKREKVIPDMLPAGTLNAPLSSGSNRGIDYVFFDTETTGLSGGAGTLVFLAAIGRTAIGKSTENGFSISQYFLSDFSGEHDFLSIVIKELEKSAVLVSYNGRAFDTQLLMNRAIVNRLRFTPPPQEDLLYTARRLWKKSIGSCTLQNVEARVLGIYRQDDVPGFEIPGLYLDFLKNKNAETLFNVFEHNHTDVAALAHLLARIEAVSLNPRLDPLLDTTALGLMHLRKDPLRAEKIFAAGHIENNRTASGYLGSLLKRQGRWEEAEQVWISLWQRYGDVSAALELAKYYEHRVRRYDDALRIVLSVQRKPFQTAAAAEAHKRRKIRIQRKIGNRKTG